MPTCQAVSLASVYRTYRSASFPRLHIAPIYVAFLLPSLVASLASPAALYAKAHNQTSGAAIGHDEVLALANGTRGDRLAEPNSADFAVTFRERSSSAGANLVRGPAAKASESELELELHELVQDMPDPGVVGRRSAPVRVGRKHPGHHEHRKGTAAAAAADDDSPRGSLRIPTSTAENTSVVAVHTSPFVTVTNNITEEHETEIVAATVASPSVILSTFMIMYVPLLMAWSWYYHEGQRRSHYVVMLPLTYCLVQIGQDLVNQSLAMTIKSPMAITLLQGASMLLITFWYCLRNELDQLKRLGLGSLWAWAPIALFFAAYQLVNHLVWWRCSLSERTVFMNLTPAGMLVFESLVFPAINKSASTAFRSKMALGSMVAGAVLFSIQCPDFSLDGIMVAGLMVITTIPYRLSQRWYFAGRPHMPIACLCMIDSLVLTAPALGLSKSNLGDLWATLSMWLEQPSVVIMLLASIVTFTAHHVCSLLMLRAGSATSFVMFNNLANFVVVGMGICFFGDNIMQTPLVITGISVCLFSGLWHAVEELFPGDLGSISLQKAISAPNLLLLTGN